MYQAFYRLSGDPFRLSPDHAFCYRYPSFAKGRAYMQYALQAAEGFVVVTGAPGMGKTTLINDLLADYGPSDYLVATMVNTMLDGNNILRSAAYEFGINVENLDTATVLQRLKQLFTRAHEERRPPLLVVDEAQNLSLSAMEELRMLTNLQYQGRPLLQIFLVGQEGLRDKLQDPRLEQLRQRVTAAAHLHPLNQEQTAAYIVHRLKVVGWDNYPRIKASVLPVIEEACQGVPRRINQFCSRLLLHGAVEERAVLDGSDATTVFTELSEERLSQAPGAAAQVPLIDDEAPADTAAADAAANEHIFEDAEEMLRHQKKRVMPPPQRTTPGRGAPGPFPGREDAYGHAPTPPPPPPYAEASPHGRDGAAGPSAGPGAGLTHPPRRPGPPSYPQPPGYPEHRPDYGERRAEDLDGEQDPRHGGYDRPPRRRSAGSGVGLVVGLLLLAIAGAYAWYQLDRQQMQRWLGADLEPYVPPPVERALTEGPGPAEATGSPAAGRASAGDAGPDDERLGLADTAAPAAALPPPGEGAAAGPSSAERQ